LIVRRRPWGDGSVTAGSWVFLAIGTAGVYTLSARLERPADKEVDCLVRMGLGPHRIMSNVELSVSQDYVRSFAVGTFDLRPGLYELIWAFGCWHGESVFGPGRLTILIGRPGEPAPRPLRDGEILRMARTGPR
jgi:hypothetical protein